MAASTPPVNLRVVAAQIAQKHGIDPNIFIRQIQQESGFNPNARSSAGAQGIAQFMPSTAQSYGIDPYNPMQALNAAALYDSRELAAFHNDWRQALAAYNAGAGNADKWNDPNFAGGQTFRYVRSILGGANPNATTAPTPTAPAVGPPAVRTVLPRPTPAVGLSPNILNILNQGNRIIGLPTLSSALLGSTAPTPAAAVRPAAAATPPAAAATTPVKPPKITGPTLRWIEHVATPFGLTVTSTTGGQHAKNSYHYRGRAVDFGGDPTRMAQLANYALQHASEFKELFYTGPGHPNFFISDGKVLPLSQLDPSLYKEHENHVHLAR